MCSYFKSTFVQVSITLALLVICVGATRDPPRQAALRQASPLSRAIGANGLVTAEAATLPNNATKSANRGVLSKETNITSNTPAFGMERENKPHEGVSFAEPLAWQLGAIPTNGARIHASNANRTASASSGQHATLREWLSAGNFDVSLVPIANGAAMLTSLLDLLQNQGLGNISSAGGCSTASLVAALWSYKQSPSANGFARNFGRLLRADHCEWHECDPETRAYVWGLDRPMGAEMACLQERRDECFRNGLKFIFPGELEPTKKFSDGSRLLILRMLDALGIPRSFGELPRPVTVTAHDQERDTQLVFDSGDLWTSILSSMAGPTWAKPLRVGGGFNGMDGYFGDDHAVRGYDELPLRSGRLLNIIPVDFLGQVAVMDWAKLRHPPESAVTIFLSVGSFLPTVGGITMEHAHLPFVSSRAVLEALRSGLSSILDAPLRADKSHSDTSSTSSLSASIDITANLPARYREWSFGRTVESVGQWLVDRQRTAIVHNGGPKSLSRSLMDASRDPNAFVTLAAEDEDRVVEGLLGKLPELQRRYLHESAPEPR